MVGNPCAGTITITLGALALHATNQSPYNIIAEDASVAIDAKYWIKKRDQRKKHLRRHYPDVHSANQPEQKNAFMRKGEGASTSTGSNQNVEYGQSSISIDDRSSYAIKRRLKSCLGWHTEMSNQDGCSKDSNYPEEWKAPGLKENMFLTTAEACCARFYPGVKCEIYNNGDCEAEAPDPAQSSSSSSSSSCKWHADIDTADGCTDDDNYPKEWLSAGMAANMFVATAEQCCDIFFYGKACSHYKRGGCESEAEAPDPAQSSSSSSSSSCKWHTDIDKNDGCTDDDNYPEEWLRPDMAANMFVATAEQCCDKFYGKACFHYERGCEGRPTFRPTPKPDPVPTSKPTKPPTPKRTRKPTTRKPTHTPTSAAPTVTPIYYYINSFGLCISEAETPRPSYDIGIYTDMVTCCHFTLAKKQCLAKIPADLLVPEEPLPPLYYSPYGSSICVDSNAPDMAKPYYITDTFGEYDECCHEASLDLAVCLESRPAHLAPSDYTPEKIPDKFVEITVYGDVGIQLLTIPKHNSPGWSSLKSALIRTITSVMLKSQLVAAEGLVIELLTFAGQSFQYRFRRRLSNSAKDDNTINSVSSPWTQERRRASGLQILQFEMTIAALCDADCQSASGSLGRAAFDELHTHLQYYVETGVFSSILMKLGKSLGIFGEADVPSALSAALLYRYAVESSVTFMPTWSPTDFVYRRPSPKPNTREPSSGPSVAPSSEPSVRPIPLPIENGIASLDDECVSASWHPLENFSKKICTNNFNYPGLWNSASARPHFLFITAEKCCNYFGFSPDCNIKDICASGNTAAMANGANTAKKASKSPTKRPTPEPTKGPTGSPTTSKPTNKKLWGPTNSAFPPGADWYVEQSTNKCVQDCEEGAPCGGLKGEWTESFVTAEECCLLVSWKSFQDCASTAFPTVSPSIPPSKAQPTSTPTKEPTEAPSPFPVTAEPTFSPTSECNANKWHFKRAHNWCTNDSSYPSLWDYDEDLGTLFLFNTVEECCTAKIPEMPCDVKDVCDTQSSSCGGQYHPTTPDLRTCSNSNDYPSAWNNNPSFIFETKEACCDAFYSDGLCFIKEACQL